MAARWRAPALALATAVVLAAGPLRANAEPKPGQSYIAPPWRLSEWPGNDPAVSLLALERGALVPPARYRVAVIPGSGCTGWAPVAQRYFAGLLHAELWVLHKPGVDILAGLDKPCSADFVAQDRLTTWRNHARSALNAYSKSRVNTDSAALALPLLLVGISEGAELLPSLAPVANALAGLVMVSSSGLDPREAGALQAQRRDQWPAWQALALAQASTSADSMQTEGRTLGYWRDFWHWSVAEPLLALPWPLWRVWGEADEAIPRAAYDQFTQHTGKRQAPFCDWPIKNADHGLQNTSSEPHDGVQWLWAQLENWARAPDAGFCPAPPPAK